MPGVRTAFGYVYWGNHRLAVSFWFQLRRDPSKQDTCNNLSLLSKLSLSLSTFLRYPLIGGLDWSFGDLKHWFLLRANGTPPRFTTTPPVPNPPIGGKLTFSTAPETSPATFLPVILYAFLSLGPTLQGYGSKFNHQQKTASFSPWFQFPGFHFGYDFF